MNAQVVSEEVAPQTRLAPSVAAMFLSLVGVYVIPFQIGAWVDGLGIRQSVAGFMGSLEIGAVAIVSVALARWVARVAPASLALGGVALVVTGQLATAFLANVTLIATARLIVGAGCGCLLASATAVTAASHDPERAFGRIYSLTSIGYAVYTTVLPFCATQRPQFGIFAISAGFAVLLTPLLFLLPRKQLARPESGHPYQAIPINWGRAGMLLAIITLVFTVLGGVYFFAERIGSRIGVPPEVIGATYGASSVAGFLFAGIAGFVGSRHGRRYPIALGAILSGIVCASMMVVKTELTFIALLVMLGGLYMYELTYAIAAAADLDPLGRFATAAQGYILISMSFGSYLYGMLTETRGSAFMAVPTLVACGAGAILTFGLFRRNTSAMPHAPIQ